MSSSGSDSGDEDYVPSDCGSQPPSEVESDGDEEDWEACDDGKVKIAPKEGKKRGKKSENDEPSPEEEVRTEDMKQKSESLWSDFLKDVSSNGAGSKEECVMETSKAIPEKKRVTEVYEFAGEKVTVSKEVIPEVPSKVTALVLDEGSVASAAEEMPEETRSDANETMDKSKISLGSVSRSPALGLSDKSRAVMKPSMRSGGSSGLSAALDKLGKKNKLSTLEKSKLDWDNYKSKEGISEEITAHNKGKSGFLDKRDFLEKTDLKQYELEKQMRNSLRRKL